MRLPILFTGHVKTITMNLTFEMIAAVICASFVVSLVSLTGMFALWIEPQRLKRIIPYLVALAVGVLLGMLLFFVLEKLVRWRHDHHIDIFDDNEPIKPIAKMNLMGDAVHNFVDGILISGSFIVDPVLGLTTTVAIIAHEIPQEIGDVGALVYGGYPPAKAVLYNFYCSLSVVVGAIFTLLFSQVAESSLVLLLPIAAGGFIYIAATDMIPALHEHSTLPHLFGQTAIFAFGIGFMQSIIILEYFLFNQ